MVGMYSRVVYTPWRNRSDARDNLTLQQLIGFDLWRVKEVDSALFQVSPYKEETNWKQIFILSFFFLFDTRWKNFYGVSLNLALHKKAASHRLN